MELKEIERLVKLTEDLENLLITEKDLNQWNLAYKTYEDTLRMVAPYDFISYNKYLELDEDKTDKNRGFYHHRQHHLGEIFQALNDMEIYDTYDMMLLSTPPRVGKSTIGIRFLSWIIGRHPLSTQLGTSYSDNITTSFYVGVMEIVLGERFNKVFPSSRLMNQNAKKQEIWLKEFKRYPSIGFVSIGGSMTGRAEASNYLYCDDLVSGIEEALSFTRLENLWTKYSVNATQRKKDGAKEIHIATRWSVHDPISKLAIDNVDNPRCKIISIPCYDENGESNFDFFGGFSTKYYDDIKKGMDEASFNALYMCEPIEREGLLYKEDELSYFFKNGMPKDRPDTIISVADTKNLGRDYVASPIGYVYGDTIYIVDVVYNNGLPEITRPLIANKWTEHNVVRADIEMNNGGNYYAETVQELIDEKGGNTSIRMFFTSENKTTKIITYSDFVKKNFVFLDKSQYSPNSEYGKFMKDVLRWTQTGKNPNDDAPDSLAMLSQLFQDLQGNVIKLYNRRELGI